MSKEQEWHREADHRDSDQPKPCVIETQILS